MCPDAAVGLTGALPGIEAVPLVGKDEVAESRRALPSAAGKKVLRKRIAFEGGVKVRRTK
jgi:hypothetical protein